MSGLTEGMRVRALFWPGENQSVSVGGDVAEIVVVMERGPMGYYPWFESRKEDGKVFRYNSLHIDCYELLPEPTP